MGTELFHCFALEDPSHDLHTRQRNTFSKCQVHKVSIQRFVSVGAFNKCQLYVRTELMISSGKFFNSSSKNVSKDDIRILVIFSCIFHNKNCFPLRTAKKKLDNRSFFGGILHVCYAPEFETVDDTREKLQERRKVIAKKTRGEYDLKK